MRTVRSKKLRLPAGTTLLEGIIAIGVIITAVVGSLVLIMTTIKLGRANQDRVVAQNLAMEGVELAISLRNSASLMRASDASISWDEDLVGYKYNDYVNINYLDIGADLINLYQTTGNYKYCFERGANDDDVAICSDIAPEHCTKYDFKDDLSTIDVDAGQSVPEGEVDRCDVIPLANYIFAGWDVPRLCDEIWAVYGPLALGGDGTFSTSVPCDYTEDGRIDVSDVVYMINKLSSGSYHFTNGYPRISVSRPIGNSVAVFGLDIYFSTIRPDSNTGIYDISDSVTGLWNDARARISNYNNTYVQNAGFTGTPTKYYRVVSAQEVCRYTNGTVQESIIPQNNGFDCQQYVVKTLGLAAATGISKVGAFITSEVRWPTPTSSTKAVYQTYVYDWLAL